MYFLQQPQQLFFILQAQLLRGTHCWPEVAPILMKGTWHLVQSPLPRSHEIITLHHYSQIPVVGEDSVLG